MCFTICNCIICLLIYIDYELLIELCQIILEKKSPWYFVNTFTFMLSEKSLLVYLQNNDLEFCNKCKTISSVFYTNIDIN